MRDELKRLVKVSEMHSFQVIALVGLVMSVVAHAIMLLLDRPVPSFAYIYPTWVLIFLAGYVLNLRSRNDEPHHH